MIADYFTKWTEAVPLCDQEAATVASVCLVSLKKFILIKEQILNQDCLRKITEYGKDTNNTIYA